MVFFTVHYILTMWNIAPISFTISFKLSNRSTQSWSESWTLYTACVYYSAFPQIQIRFMLTTWPRYVGLYDNESWCKSSPLKTKPMHFHWSIAPQKNSPSTSSVLSLPSSALSSLPKYCEVLGKWFPLMASWY